MMKVKGKRCATLLAATALIVGFGCAGSPRSDSRPTSAPAVAFEDDPDRVIDRLRSLESDIAAVAAEKVWGTKLTGPETVRRAWLDGTTLLMETRDPVRDAYVMHCVDAAVGRSKWQVVLGPNPLSRAPHVGEGTIAFLTENDNGLLVVQSHSGSRLYHIAARTRIVPSSDAISTLDTVYLGNYLSDRITAISADDGRSGWDVIAGGEIKTTPVLTSGLSQQLVMFGTDRGFLGAVPAKAFHEAPPEGYAWSRQFSGGVTADMAYTIATSGEDAIPLAIVPCEDNFCYGVDPITGRSQWVLRTNKPFKSEPHVAGGRVFVRNTERLFCLDAATGNRVWNSPRLEGREGYELSEFFPAAEGFEVADRLLAASEEHTYLLIEPNMVLRCKSEDGAIDGRAVLSTFDFLLTNEANNLLIAGTRDGYFLGWK